MYLVKKNKVWYTCTLFIKVDIHKHIACCSTRLYLIFGKEFDRAHISYISSSARGIGDKPTDRSSYAKIHKLKKEKIFVYNTRSFEFPFTYIFKFVHMFL